MLRTVHSEDELAAVLAHEVAHVNFRHGIDSISKSRWTDALAIIGTEAAKTYGSADVARLAGIFEASIDDIFKTLVVNGYSRGQEEESDRASLVYLARAGYNPKAMADFLDRLKQSGRGSSGGLLDTHPAASDRLGEVRGSMPDRTVNPLLEQARTKRFSATVLF